MLGFSHVLSTEPHWARLSQTYNEYLERLTRTGPKRLHVLYKYILSKFNAYRATLMHTHTHAHTQTQSHTHARARARAHTRTHTHTHTPVTYQGNETEEKGFPKRERFSARKTGDTGEFSPPGSTFCADSFGYPSLPRVTQCSSAYNFYVKLLPGSFTTEKTPVIPLKVQVAGYS